MGKNNPRWTQRLLQGVTFAVFASVSPQIAQAAVHPFNIPSQDLAKALRTFSVTSNTQVLFDGSVVKHKTSHPVLGNYQDTEALGVLLEGTGLAYDATTPGIILVRLSPHGKQLPVSDPARPPPPPEIEPIVIVTGSRLAAKGYWAPVPVSVIEGNSFAAGGFQTVETRLQQSPQFVSNLYNSAGNGQNQGIAALNLRGLGERRSLTLVNGRRFTVTGTSALTDLNTIPPSLVKRVEVVTGGSSAVYGSDAIAGVVNFIMRDDFQGVELQAQTKFDAHTGTPERAINLTIGGNFADHNGNAVLSLDYSNRQGILRSRYDWAAFGLADRCVTPETYNAGGPGTPMFVPAGQTCSSVGGRAGFAVSNSSVIPGGRFTGLPLYGSASSTPGLDSALLAAGLQDLTNFGFTFDKGSQAARPAQDPGDRWNNTPYNYMQTPLTRWILNGFAHYDINRNATAYLETHYSDITSVVQIAPLAISGNVLIDVNNPFLSPADREVLHQLDLAEAGQTTVKAGSQAYTTAAGDGLAVLGMNTRLTEGGPARSITTRNTFRTVVGLRGQAFDRVTYDLYYSMASTQTTENQSAVISRSGFQAAILSQNGAAPLLNIFGENVDPEVLASLTVPSVNTTENEQQVLAGNISGYLFKLPAGSVDFSSGFEWRYNRLQVRPDALSQTGDTANAIGVITAVSGSTTVKELYTEFRIPLLKDAPFARQLALTGAARYSHYDTAGVGGVWTSSLGAQWQPVNGLTLRFQRQRAIRAPGVDELYAAVAAGTPVANDPCSNRVDSGLQTAEVRTLCIATGVPAPNVFTAAVQPNAQIGTVIGGNSYVGPETSRTTTFGIVYSPKEVSGLALSADWFKIDVDNAISSLGGNLQNLFNLCYYILKDSNSDYCKAIHRSPAGEITSNNFADAYFVNQIVTNTGGLKTSGIDFNGRYTFNVPFAPFAGRSRIDISTSWTFTSEYTIVAVQTMPSLVQRCVGAYGATCGAPLPEWKGDTRIVWQNGPLSLSIHHRYTGPVGRDTYLLALRQGLPAPDKANISAVEVPAYHYFDVAVSFDCAGRFTVTGGINNLSGVSPPILGSGATTWGLNTAPGTYEIYGRTLFLGVKKQF